MFSYVNVILLNTSCQYVKLARPGDTLLDITGVVLVKDVDGERSGETGTEQIPSHTQSG